MNAWTRRRAAAITLVGACWIAMGVARAAESAPSVTLLVAAPPQAGSRELVLTAWVQRAPAGSMVSFREVAQASPWSSGLREIDRGRAQATAPASDRPGRRFQAVLLDEHEREQAVSSLVASGSSSETVRRTTTVASPRRLVDTASYDDERRARLGASAWVAAPSTTPVAPTSDAVAMHPASGSGQRATLLPAPAATTPAPKPALANAHAETTAPMVGKVVATAKSMPAKPPAAAPAPALKLTLAKPPVPAPVAAPAPKPAAATTSASTRSSSTSRSTSSSKSTSSSTRKR